MRRALLLLTIALAGCASVETKPETQPIDFGKPAVEDVIAEYVGDAIKARMLIERLREERDEARKNALTCEAGRST